jgi:bacillithiol biosynthesis deacetylase BshB1
LRHIALGYSVGLADLTRGELGTRGNADLRTEEALSAANFMGARFRVQFNLRDGFFSQGEEELMAVIRLIRECRPSLVLANAVRDRHPDHGRAARLVADAAFYAGLSKVVTTGYHGQNQERWRPAMLMHYIQDHQLEPDIAIDISEYMDDKINLLQCYASQFYQEQSPEPATPISGADFFETIRANAKVVGRPCGFSYGEGFQLPVHAGIQDVFQSFPALGRTKNNS